MKTVKIITHILHYVFIMTAMLAMLALVSLSGTSVRNILIAEPTVNYAGILFGFGFAFVLSVVLAQVGSWAEKYAISKL